MAIINMNSHRSTFTMPDYMWAIFDKYVKDGQFATKSSAICEILDKADGRKLRYRTNKSTRHFRIPTKYKLHLMKLGQYNSSDKINMNQVFEEIISMHFAKEIFQSIKTNDLNDLNDNHTNHQ